MDINTKLIPDENKELIHHLGVFYLYILFYQKNILNEYGKSFQTLIIYVMAILTTLYFIKVFKNIV